MAPGKALPSARSSGPPVAPTSTRTSTHASWWRSGYRWAIKALAWSKGYDALQSAIDENFNFAFETTLGGSSITVELLRALAVGRRVTILYIGLESPELHIQRVAERVARAGHNIPQEKIRERFDSSRAKLLRFIGTRAQIRVCDNSHQTADRSAAPAELFRVQKRKALIPKGAEISQIAGWAQALVAKALSVVK